MKAKGKYEDEYARRWGEKSYIGDVNYMDGNFMSPLNMC